MCNRPCGNMRRSAQEIFYKPKILLLALHSRSESRVTCSFEVQPEVVATTQPLLPPGYHRISRRGCLSNRNRKSQKQQIGVMTLGNEASHVLVSALVAHRVVVWLGKTIKHPAKSLRKRKRLAQIAGLLVERENVIASHHSGSQCEGPLIRFKMLSIEAQIIKPPC